MRVKLLVLFIYHAVKAYGPALSWVILAGLPLMVIAAAVIIPAKIPRGS